MQYYKSLLSIITLILISACATIRAEFLLSGDKKINKLEKEDHKFCNNLELDFNKIDTAKSRLYWRCRLSMAKYKLHPEVMSQQNMILNAQINDLIKKIEIKIIEAKEPSIQKISKRIDNHDHKKCLNMGFVIDTKDEAKISDYFACRKILIDDYSVIPPFFNSDYVKHPIKSYNLPLAVDLRIDERIQTYRQAEEKYPTCMNLFSNKNEFTKCTILHDKSKECTAEISKKKFKKETAEKITCQKKSYLQFPDEFLKEDELAKKELERTKKNSDYYNHYNFVAIGIDDPKKFGGDQKPTKQEEKPKINPNSKENLYTKSELTRLRQDYVIECQKEIDTMIKKYDEELQKSCKDITKNEDQML